MRQVLLLLAALASSCHADKKVASCELETNKVMGGIKDKVKGMVTFTQETETGPVSIKIQLEGFDKTDASTKHGFHVHADSDMSTSCSGMGGHYNPKNMNHGAPGDSVRHVGDLGNIEENSDGKVALTMSDSVISLNGQYSIIGRAIVVHEKADDLGLGGVPDSLTTGNAGGRLACCVIKESSSGAVWRINVVLLCAVVLLSIFH